MLETINDLSIITIQTEFSDGTYSIEYLHIPFIVLMFFYILMLFIFNRIIIELIIRLRK